MNQEETRYRNVTRDIWCVKDADGNIVSISEVPKDSLTPEQILENMQESHPDMDLEIYSLSAEEHDEHEKKVMEGRGRRIHESDIVKRVPEIRAHKRANKVERLDKK